MPLSCRSMAIPAETRMGPVHLTVADLERSLDYYRRAIGLDVIDRSAGRASLGANSNELLVLTEEPGARPDDGHTGLYHFALLVPERADLARWLAHAARDRVRLVGLSDHFVSEAIYLSDPDGHGIEIYWDRPRHAWEGQVAERMTTLPLDVNSLLGELDDYRRAPFDGLPPATAAPTGGGRQAPRRRRPTPPRCATPRWCCPKPPSAPGSSNASRPAAR